jgi:hypothetical protein
VAPRLLVDAKQAIEAQARYVTLNVAANIFGAALAGVALFFFTLAAFVWAQSEAGTILASLALGFVYLALSVGVYLRARRRARRAVAERPKLAQRFLLGEAESSERGLSWLGAPVAIAAGIEILRRLGARRLIPVFTLAAVMIATLQAKPAPAEDADLEKKPEAEEENGGASRRERAPPRGTSG